MVMRKYIAAIEVKQYATEVECFVPLMEKFKQLYGQYPKYPVADAGVQLEKINRILTPSNEGVRIPPF